MDNKLTPKQRAFADYYIESYDEIPRERMQP